MTHGRHRVYHTDRVASIAVSVVWMLHYTAAPHRGSILDLETGRTTAVLCKGHEASSSNHIARCPNQATKAVQSTQHAGIHDRCRAMTLSFSSLFTQFASTMYPPSPCGSEPTVHMGLRFGFGRIAIAKSFQHAPGFLPPHSAHCNLHSSCEEQQQQATGLGGHCTMESHGRG